VTATTGPATAPVIPRFPGLANRVALVTGANHGIGAATAEALAANGASVLITFLRVADEPEPGTPAAYAENRSRDASAVVARIRKAGGQAESAEADLSEAAAIPVLFDRAEAAFGPVEILVNNASGWLADTFGPQETDGLGRGLSPVAAATHDQVFDVDARAAALLIAEFARRHAARDGNWGRIIGLTSGGPLGFPGEVSYGAAKAAQVNYTMSAALELARHGITANVVHPPITDTGWVTPAVEDLVATSQEHFHVARPSDVAEVIAYLASDLGRLITANVIQLR
jgi:3-oxoacyl-[acyl-carrier protein] reductase